MSLGPIYATSRAIVYVYARAMLRLDVFWKAPPPTGPMLVVANHPSCSDPVFLPLLFRQRVRMLITENAFSVPVIGFYLRRLGHLAVTPDNGRVVLEAARGLLESGATVALFPEGRLSPRRGGLRQPRAGAARLAMLTGVPVVPMGIYLAREHNHAIVSTVTGKRTLGYWYMRGPYNVTVGAAMQFEGDPGHKEKVASVSDAVMRQIAVLSLESERRAKADNPFSTQEPGSPRGGA